MALKSMGLGMQNETLRDFIDRSRDKEQDFLNDALEGIKSEHEECFHTPDKLSHLGTDYRSDEIIQHFECQCGKIIREVFSLSETRVY